MRPLSCKGHGGGGGGGGGGGLQRVLYPPKAIGRFAEGTVPSKAMGRFAEGTVPSEGHGEVCRGYCTLQSPWGGLQRVLYPPKAMGRFADGAVPSKGHDYSNSFSAVLPYSPLVQE